jgi:hypothetical protein
VTNLPHGVNSNSASKWANQPVQATTIAIPTPTVTEKSQWTNVVLVSKENAKSLKMALERASLLDMTFRMTKSTTQPPTDYYDDSSHHHPQQLIAVPITTACLKLLQSTPATTTLASDGSSSSDNHSHDNTIDWRKWVHGIGQQKVPFRTAHYARGSKKAS